MDGFVLKNFFRDDRRASVLRDRISERFDRWITRNAHRGMQEHPLNQCRVFSKGRENQYGKVVGSRLSHWPVPSRPMAPAKSGYLREFPGNLRVDRQR